MTTYPKPILGIIEGFYGVYYTFPERNDLIRFGEKHGFNTYLYAPKNDRQHRACWREDYPAAIMAQFIEVLEHWMWMTRFSFKPLRAVETGHPYLNDLKRVHEYRQLIQNHPKRTAGHALLPLVDLILNHIENGQRKRLAFEWLSIVS
jgi:hypothetical protein